MPGLGDARLGSGGASLRALVALLGLYSAGAVFQRPQTYIELLLEYLSLAVRASLVVTAIGLVVLVLSKARGDRRRLTALLVQRFSFGVAGIVLFSAGLAAFSTYKLLIPSLMPFIWDAPFDAIDRFLHGAAPWELTHAVLPIGLTNLIGLSYGIPWFLYWFGTLAYVVFCAREPIRGRYLWAMALTIGLLGTVAATLFASHGPIFFPHFGLDGYGGLADALRQTAFGRGMLASADYLYGAYASGEARFGSGISAMPSMHVAIVTLNLCFYVTLDRRLGMVAAAFAALIVIGSVHFGWHYAIDAYASMVVVPVLWWLAGRLQDMGQSVPLLVPQPRT